MNTMWRRVPSSFAFGLAKRPLMITLAVGLLLIGCDGAETRDSETSPAAPSTAASTTTSSTATELVTPIAYGPTSVVAGREDCALYPPAVMPTETRNPDGTVHFRGGRFECTVTNDDPRIAGIAYYTLDMDRWGASEESTAQAMWGTIRIENEGGAWQADYVGVYTSKWGDVFTALFSGSGGYEGLSYYQWAVETFGASWPTRGLIFPGDGAAFPAPEVAIEDVVAAAVTETKSATAEDLPAPIAYGPTVLVTGREECDLYPPAIEPTQTGDSLRDAGFACTVINNDPRIAGTAYSVVNVDRWITGPGEGTQVMWGATRIENDGGAWETEYVGVYAGDWGDVTGALYAGTGGYEGLSYYQWTVETHGATWPTKGLIFPSSGLP